MSFSNFAAGIAKGCVKLITKKSPLLLTLFGMGLSVGATVEGISSTPEAYERYKAIMKKDIPESEKRKEILVNVVPLYIPTFILTGTSIAAVVSGYKINSKRLAEMTTAYLLAANSAREYKEAVIEKIGGEANEEIENAIQQRKIDAVKNNKNNVEDISSIDEDQSLAIGLRKKRRFCDSITGQYFTSTASQIINTCQDLESRLTIEDCICASEYAYEVGLKKCDKAESVGWLTGDMLRPRIEDIPKIDPEDGMPYYDVLLDVNPDFPVYRRENRY